jgi:nitrogen fixation protein NifT
MAKVMLRENEGKLYFYVAKKDMEEVVESVEFDTDEKWGGEIKLSNGQTWFIEPAQKILPNEVVAKKLAED